MPPNHADAGFSSLIKIDIIFVIAQARVPQQCVLISAFHFHLFCDLNGLLLHAKWRDKDTLFSAFIHRGTTPTEIAIESQKAEDHVTQSFPPW